MSTFNSYEKVERIEKEECRGLLEGRSFIFEKIDGANAQIFLLDSEIAFGSRNRVLGVGDNLISGDSFRGFYPWVKENTPLLKHFFSKHPNVTLYGEWLVKHSVPYPTEFMNKFYCFDIMNNDDGVFHPTSLYDPCWDLLRNTFSYIYPIAVEVDGMIENCTIEDLKKYLEMPSHYGAPYREGIVIKNYEFINKYGRTPYGKLLNKDFMEVKGKTKKNINPADLEVEIANAYCTWARVVKICHKIKFNEVSEATSKGIDENIADEIDKYRFEMSHIPKVINMVFYDIITEDMNDILKKFRYPTIDFKKLKAVVFDITKKYFVEYLQKQS